MAGVRAASWLWSRGEAWVAAAAELLCNIAPMNPLPHLASADSFLYLPTRRSMKIQAAAVADHAARLHAGPCWALLFFFVGLMCTGSLLREGFSMPLFERKDMEKRIFRVLRHTR